MSASLGSPGSRGRRRGTTDLGRALEVALEALKTDRVRTRSAVVALAIAMAVVACLTTLVERGRAATIRALEAAGLNNLYLIQRPAPRGGALALDLPLTREDGEKLRDLTGARALLAIRIAQSSIAGAGAPFPAPLYAVSGPLERVFAARARAGRLTGDLDVARKSPYCVVGSAIARRAGVAAPVGGVLNVGTRSYEIVGELEPTRIESAATGEIPAIDWDHAVIVPLGSEPAPLDEPDSRYPVDVAVLSFGGVAQAGRSVDLPARIDPDRFGPAGTVRVASPIQTLRQYKQTRRTFDRIVWLVAVLTAGSAVFGISNLLSASVVARTREIGLRRAVGARASDIVLQFQAEGLLLGIAGGGLGLIAGAAISLATLDASGRGGALSFVSFSILAAVCVLIGILTGIRPSIRASRIDPAAALREG